MEEKLEFLQEIVDLKNKKVLIDKKEVKYLSKIEQFECKHNIIYAEIDAIESYDVIFEEGDEPMFLSNDDSYFIFNNKLMIKKDSILRLYNFNLLTYEEKIKRTTTKPLFTQDLRCYESLTYGLGSAILYNIFIPYEYDKIITPLSFREHIELDKKLSQDRKDLLSIKLIYHPFKESLFDKEEEEEKKYKYPENVF